MISQADLVAKLDRFFNIKAFDESAMGQFFSPGYESIFQRFAVPTFQPMGWNGLMLDNTSTFDRVYLIVFPSQDVLDTIIAREVERGAPGALIFCHHMADYQEAGPGYVFITEPQLEELTEHKISYYTCHAPLDCHPETSTAGAFAKALKFKGQERFGNCYGEKIGVLGKVGPISFGEFARKVAEVTGLPNLRYSQLRHNARPVQQVGIITGTGGDPVLISEAISLGCDTFVTGEWWLFGPGDWRAQHRERIRTFLTGVNADINLIGTSHYASEALVMRDQLPDWFRDQSPGVEAVFVPQADPWR